MTSDERVTLGLNAQALLNNRAYAAAMAALREELLGAFMRSEPTDASGREAIHYKIHALQWLDTRIRTLATDGEAETRRINSRSIVT